MTKTPLKLEVLLCPDASGIELGDVKASFAYGFAEDPNAGGLLQSVVVLDQKNALLLKEVYDAILNQFSVQKGVISKDEFKKSLQPKPEA